MTELLAYPGKKNFWLDTPRTDSSFNENLQEDTEICYCMFQYPMLNNHP